MAHLLRHFLGLARVRLVENGWSGNVQRAASCEQMRISPEIRKNLYATIVCGGLVGEMEQDSRVRSEEKT